MTENVVSSVEATKKNPSQGKFKSVVQAKRIPAKIDKNRHGIRRETTPVPPKKPRFKKV